jgi:TetR/AcrR family transcriptional repressor of nem operon
MSASSQDASQPARSPRLTARGAATRARIVAAAAELMRAQGVAGTTFDDVRAASGTSKSQLYHHFPDRRALVGAVIALRGDELLGFHRQHLDRLRSIRGLERWRDVVVGRIDVTRGAHGCVLGSLASELVDQDDEARAVLQDHFRSWEDLFVAGFERMRTTGVLREDADPEKLATGVMAAVQGGHLLSQLARDSRPMGVALDMAIDAVKASATRRGA